MAQNTLKKDSQGRVEPQQSGYGIRQIYNPPQAQKDTLKFVYKDRYMAMKQGSDRMEVEKLWDTWEKQAEGWRSERRRTSDGDQWQSNHVSPVTTSVIQTAVSEMVDQDMKPFYVPQGIEKQAKADLMQHVWDFGWDTARSDLMMYDVFIDMLGQGTAITQEYYRQEKRLVRDIVIGKDKTETEEKEREVYDYDDVYGEIVRIQDFFIDETARSFDNNYPAKDCIRRYIMDIDDFMTMYQGTKWDQFDNAQFVKPGGDTYYYEWYQPPDGMDKSRQVEVLHYWGIRPKDRFVIVANDIVIRDGANPYKHKQLPFCRAVDIRRPHKFYGKGEPELLESIQDETNTLRRMIIDRNHLDIDKMFLVSNRIGLTDEDLVARPHGMIPTDDMGATKPVEYGDIPRSVEVSLQALEDDSVLATGINPRQQSLPSASTATQAAMLKESTLKRIQLKLWLLKQEFFPRMAQLRTENFLQFYSQPRLVKIVGEEAEKQYQNQMTNLQNEGLVTDDEGNKYMQMPKQIQVKNKNITRTASGDLQFSSKQGYSSFDLKANDFMPLARGGYIVKFEAGTNIQLSKPLLKQQNLELFDRLSPIAMQVPGTYDIVKLADMLLRDSDKNPDDFKPDAQVQDDSNQRAQDMIQLANMEIAQMSQGTPVAPTPYATPAHTRVILTFMNGDKFKQMPDKDHKLLDIFTQHVMGEMMAQEARSQSGGQPPQPGSIGQDPNQQQGSPPPPPVPPGGSPLPPPPNASNGMQNKPGGMGQPSTGTMGTNMPAQQVGGNMPR